MSVKTTHSDVRSLSIFSIEPRRPAEFSFATHINLKLRRPISVACTEARRRMGRPPDVLAQTPLTEIYRLTNTGRVCRNVDVLPEVCQAYVDLLIVSNSLEDEVAHAYVDPHVFCLRNTIFSFVNA